MAKIYPYAVAAVRSMENKLLSKQMLIQMAEAKSFDDAYKLLKETEYGKGDQKDSLSYEAMVSNHLANIYASVAMLMDEDNFVDIFLYKNDYHNIKVLIKSELSKENPDKFLLDGGTIPIDKLKEAFRERDYGELSNVEPKAIEDAFELYSKSNNARVIDFIIDRACFKAMAKAAEKTKLDYVIKYVSILSDLTNIKALNRIDTFKLNPIIIEDAYVEGGELSLEFFVNALKEDNVKEAIEGTKYKAILSSDEKISLSNFEKNCDNFLMEYIKDAKYQCLSPEPVVAFILAKEAEAKCLRTIFYCKENDIDPEIIKERVRETYV